METAAPDLRLTGLRFIRVNRSARCSCHGWDARPHQGRTNFAL